MHLFARIPVSADHVKYPSEKLKLDVPSLQASVLTFIAKGANLTIADNGCFSPLFWIIMQLILTVTF